MSSSAANKEICPACAAEVREGAVFCFNCGKSLGELKAVASASAVTMSASDGGEAAASAETPVADRQEKRPLKVRQSSDSPRRPARSPKREMEIEWAVPEEGPGAAFVLGAAAVGAVSLLVFLIAVYLK